MTKVGLRTERDALGSVDIPSSSYWGVQTERARSNFAISGITLKQYPSLIIALAKVKHAAATANESLGVMSKLKASAIRQACDEIIAGEMHDQFVVDMIQGGAGTSTNMNANEVIANRAIEILGGALGDYGVVSPNDDVNCSQSTNDVYPTAIKLALILEHLALVDALEGLVSACTAKRDEFWDILKLGRTQLQDAVPMTVGQEFGAFAQTLKEEIARLSEAANLLKEVNLGATAIGTGINAPARFGEICTAELSTLIGENLSLAENLIEATSDAGSFVSFSSTLKRMAIKLSKICNDLRLLSSGPRGGLGELNLPAVQAGSSIMPGKVNPVIPEVMNQIAFIVIGNDLTITLAAEAGQLQLNAFEPTIAFRLLNSVRLLVEGINTLTTKCVLGISVNEHICRENVDMSIGLATFLNPVIGYSQSAKIAQKALRENKSVIEIAKEREGGLGDIICEGLARVKQPSTKLDGTSEQADIAIES